MSSTLSGSRASRARRTVAFATALAALLTLPACGSRRDPQEFVTAAQGTGVGFAQGALPAQQPGAAPDVTQTGAVPAAAEPGAPGKAAPGAGIAAAPASGGKEAGAPASANNQAKGGTTTAGGSGDKCATSGAAITIGNVSTLSGLLGELFKGVPEALQVWASQANACGGLGGHPVRVVSADDGADPATALTIAKRMVENDKVLAFAGNANPLSIYGMAEYLKEVGVPMVGGDSTELPYFENPVFFPIGPFVSVIGAAAAQTAVTKGAKKIAVLYCAEVPQSCGPVGGAKELQVGSPVVQKLGGEIVMSQKSSMVSPSYTSQCLAAKRAAADAIIAIMDGPSVGRLSASCAAQDYRPLYLSISLALSANLTDFEHLNDNFFSPLNTFPWADQSTAASKKYHEDFQRYLGRFIGGPAPAMAYVSGMLAQRAAEAGLPANPKPADLIKGLLTIKNETLGGLVAPLTFTSEVPRKGIVSCTFQIAIIDKQFAAPQGSKCIPVDARGPGN